MTNRSLYPVCVIVLFTTFLFPLAADGQKEGYVWYFGGNIGIDFDTNPPQLLQKSSLNTYEGCSSISDKDGNLLFYTDGVTIWNSEHQVMENGMDLTGHSSSTQSGLIVAKPGSKTVYYVFTVDASENFMRQGLEYAVVDLSDGKGKVVEKNLPLMSPGTEKVTGVIHKNGRDIWIISHKWNTDEYYAFLLTPKGIEVDPVISSTGSRHFGDLENAIGYLKASADGNKIAAAIYREGLVEIFDFNNENGVLEKSESIKFTEGLPYGIEFSPNGRFLYVSTHFDGGIYQYDLQANILHGSRSVIRKPDKSNTGALQLAPDGKIYAQLFQKDHLAVIKEPEEGGVKSRYHERGFYIGPKAGRYGLPTFVQSFFDLEYLQEIKTYYLSLELPLSPDSIVMIKNGVTERYKTPPSDYELKSNESVNISISKKGFFKQKFVIDSSNVNEFLDDENNVVLKIDLQEIRVEEEIVLENIYYNYNSAELREDAYPALETLLDMLKDNPDVSVQINAHTDCRGSDEYNRKLSQQRAESVVKYLQNEGIEIARLKAKGNGESMLLNSCDCNECSEDQHQQNRRTTFKVLE